MKKLSFLLCLLLLLFQQAMAQQIRVSGRVTSAGTGNPAEGISVVVKGKKAGTTTGANGDFNILADKNAQLVFSGIGFTSKEVKVTGDLLDISLQPTIGDLGEVVVVGYGAQKKASLTGSIVTLNNAALNRRQVSSTSQALQGLAPGVTVQQQSGRPGGDGASIRVRGQSSILPNVN
ncbi:MAG: carboxypeptidase-like regulatory domain-containing protein, partial [Bacteroidota bacterium]